MASSNLTKSEFIKLENRTSQAQKQVALLNHELGVLEAGNEKEYILKMTKQFRQELRLLRSRTRQLEMQNDDLKQEILCKEKQISTMESEHKEVFDIQVQSSNNNNNNNSNNNNNNNNLDREWYKNKSLRRKCECEMCRLGLATTHNDESHDQSLYGKFILATDNRFELSLIGGSTKCGRIMSNYFGYLINKRKETLFNNAKILEVGSGTGIVGFTLAYLGNQYSNNSNNSNNSNKNNNNNNTNDNENDTRNGMDKTYPYCNITMTDQPGVLEILEENRNQLTANIESNCGFKFNDKISTGELLWGKDGASKYLNKNYNILVGSDLIYAKEGIEPLVTTFELLSNKPVAAEDNQGNKIGTVENGFKYPIVYMAIIRRFKWEETFFQLMSNKFTQENVLTDGDIALYRYVRKEDSKT